MDRSARACCRAAPPAGCTQRCSPGGDRGSAGPRRSRPAAHHLAAAYPLPRRRSEEHTSELQSHSDLVCRLLLEKKKKKKNKKTKRKKTKIKQTNQREDNGT